MTVALKTEKTDQQVREIATTIKYAITYATRKDQDKPKYRCDIHTNKKNRIDWHFTFATAHDWQAIKTYIRKTLGKKFNLTGRQVEVETKPYDDDGWLDYVLRAEKPGFHGTTPVKDYYHDKRTLFTKECTLRRYTNTAGFYVIGREATEKLRVERNNQKKDEANKKYFADKPDLQRTIRRHVEKIIESWSFDEWRDDDTKQPPNKQRELSRYARDCRHAKILTAEQFDAWLYAPLEPDDHGDARKSQSMIETIDKERAKIAGTLSKRAGRVCVSNQHLSDGVAVRNRR